MSELAAPLPRTATAIEAAPPPARRRNVVAVVAACALLATVLAAALAPWLPLLDPDTVDTPNRLRPPGSPGHALGTDEFGRDLLARLVWGARVSLLGRRGHRGGVDADRGRARRHRWVLHRLDRGVVMRLTDI
jgi:hypothetical protein